MDDNNGKDIIDEVQTIDETTHEKSSTTKPKKNYKIHFILLAILGVSTWGFWTYSPLASQLKNQWLPHFKISFEQLLSPETVSKKPEQITQETTTAASEPTIENYPEASTEIQQTPDSSPTFEPTYDLSLDSNAESPLTAQNFDSLAAIEAMQQQLEVIQQAMTNMQAQQTQLNQQQVRAQLFASLHQAAASQSTLQDIAIAWKSIGFMPMLHEDKRALADEAFSELQALEQSIQTISAEISTLINALAQQLNPKDLTEVAAAVEEVIATPKGDAFTSSLDWLKEQFVISKIDPHALSLSDDPYAEIKALMNNLHQLNQDIQHQAWANITNLNTLRYQLEQRGMETTLSVEMLKQLETTQQNWKNQAQTWMEQL